MRDGEARALLSMRAIMWRSLILILLLLVSTFGCDAYRVRDKESKPIGVGPGQPYAGHLGSATGPLAKADARCGERRGRLDETAELHERIVGRWYFCTETTAEPLASELAIEFDENGTWFSLESSNGYLYVTSGGGTWESVNGVIEMSSWDRKPVMTLAASFEINPTRMIAPDVIAVPVDPN